MLGDSLDLASSPILGDSPNLFPPFSGLFCLHFSLSYYS
ncbi:hypothetical protein Gotur_021950 [Gossypium turneri]